MRPDVPYRPYYCVWELTLACNLRCGHCGSSAGQPRPRELTTDEAVDVVQQLADLECKLITLSGGEPTLRQDWDRIARAAVARDIVVNMVTNGTTMSRGLAARLRDAGLVNVAVSLDGTRANHDATRGPGNFDKVLRAVEQLQQVQIPVTLLTHLNRDTAAELEAVHDLAVQVGADAWRVQLGKAMGRLAGDRSSLLEPGDLLQVLPRLARLKKRSTIWIDVGDSLGFYGPHEATLRKKRWGNMQALWSGCQAGRFAIGIESDGGVKGCLSLQARWDPDDEQDPFREGSLREQRLDALWFADGAFAFNRDQRVEDLRGYCHSCAHNARCRGGAKCVAAAFTGGVAEDPYCYHRVAREQSVGHRAAVQLRQGTAAAVLGVGLGVAGLAGPGCWLNVPGDDAGSAWRDAAVADATTALDASSSADTASTTDAATTTDATAAADATAATDGATSADVDPCANVCCECDYGVPPPAECCAPPAEDAGVAAEDAAAADVDPCANVCCECDYGVPPPPECCP